MEKKNATIFSFEKDEIIIILYAGGDFDVCDISGIKYFDTFEDLKEEHPEYAKEIDNALKEKTEWMKWMI